MSEGEWGFGDVAYERTSFAKREKGKEFVGTAAALWGITAGVYLALMGPQGMKDIGKTILQKAQYAAQKLSAIKGVKVPLLGARTSRSLWLTLTPRAKAWKRLTTPCSRKEYLG